MKVWVDHMQNNFFVLIGVVAAIFLPMTNTVLAAEKYACFEGDKVGFDRPSMQISRFFEDKFIFFT